MSSVSFKGYAQVVRGPMRLRTIVGGFMARCFPMMFTIGLLAMYTGAGYSYTLAGAGVAVVQLSNFLIAPRISRLIDRRGQRKVVPLASLVAMLALAGMLLTVHLHGPIVIAYACSALLGFTPQMGSVMRSRWSYLGRRGGHDDPTWLKTAFSFEGMLDDAGFMFAPSLAVLASANLFPIAGLLFGGIVYVVGTLLVFLDRSTEPDVAFMRANVPSARRDRADGAGADGGKGVVRANVFAAYPVVAVLFAGMFLMGFLYGFGDQGVYAVCRELATESHASIIFVLSGAASVVMGFVFGAVYIKASPVKQILGVGIACGVLFLPCWLVHSVPVAVVAMVVGGLCWAPFIITLNSVTERLVDPSRVTESLTWLNAGLQLGLAISPTIAGIFIDATGYYSAFVGTSLGALLIPLCFFACLPVLRKGFAGK